MPVIISEENPARFFEWSHNTVVGRRMIGGLSFDRRAGDDRRVSSVHGVFTWNRKQGSWELHDLGSQNGTLVNGARVEPGKPLRVTAGARIVFGTSAWTMRESEPPPAAASTDHGRLRLAVEDVLLLPDETRPEWEISLGPHGWRQRPWSSTGEDDYTAIEHGDPIEAGGRTWTLSLPSDADLVTAGRTQVAAGLVSEHRLVLRVPRNMEDIEAVLIFDNRFHPRPPRRHHELWWLLAQARLGEGEAEADEDGWVSCEEMARHLGVDGTGYLNVLVHRSRAQLRKSGFDDYSHIIERRPGPPPQLRLGIGRVGIERI